MQQVVVATIDEDSTLAGNDFKMTEISDTQLHA